MRRTKKNSWIAWIAVGCFLGTNLSGCGGGASAPPPAISISFSGGSSDTIWQGQSVLITAVVSNDSSGRGVTWTLNGPGTLSRQTSTSVEYDAPTILAGNATATVTATAAADPSKSAAFTVTVKPTPALVRLSSDPLTNGTSQHATEVEPDTFAFGSTIVSAFQVGRIFGGGAADIGFATSTDGGATWTNGLLPGITIFQGGTLFNAVSDPAVAYDAAHSQWIIASIAVQEDSSGNPTAEQVLVSRSPDGVNWGDPIAVNPLAVYDKDWIVCDNISSSPFYGHCYVQWIAVPGLMTISTSTDGGLTWQPPLHTADMVKGGAGQPVVQANGTVISPMLKQLATQMLSFTSTDGGASWSATTVISTITDHTEPGNLRSGPLPSAEIDAAGIVYVVWADCRFRTNCSSNDLVLSTSSDAVNWTPPARIPIDPVTSTVDHFLPGLAVDRTTSGNAAHLTLTYYYYPVSNCGTDCDLWVGFVSSQDGGQTWSAPVPLAGPMKTDWLAETGGDVTPGRMVGDYFSGSYVNGSAFAVFAVAAPNSGSLFDEAMYTTAQPMIPPAGALRFNSAGEMPVPNAKSDHEPRDLYPRRRRPPF